MLSLDKWISGTSCCSYKYLMGGYTEDRDRLFSVVLRDRTRGNEHKLKQKKFYRGIKKICFFTVMCLTTGSGCPERLSSSFKLLKN